MNKNTNHWYVKAAASVAAQEQKPCRHNHCINKGQVHGTFHTASNGDRFDRSR